MNQDRTQKIIIAILALLLVVVSVALADRLFFSQKRTNLSIPETASRQENENINQAPINENHAPVDEPANVNIPNKNIYPSIENAPAGELTVKWLSDLNQIDEKVLNGVFSIDNTTYANIGSSQFFKVGKVTGDIYKDNDLYYIHIVDPQCDGPGCEGLSALTVLVPKENKLVIINKYSTLDLATLDRTLIAPVFKIAKNNPNLTVAGLAAPEKITIKNGNYTATLSDTIRGLPNSNIGIAVIGKTDDGETVYDHAVLPPPVYSYDSRANDLALRLNNGEFLKYSLQIPFYSDNRIPQITWSDGTKNADDYEPRVVTGCGQRTLLDIVKDIAASELVPQGKTVNGETIYAYKDKNDLDLKNIYESWGTWKYANNTYNSGYNDDTGKPTYAAFLAMRPVFIWKDPFGRLIRWTRGDIQPMAECGKPVVYSIRPRPNRSRLN